MRTWIVALLIALLPLRGWVGDAMAQAPAVPAGEHTVLMQSADGVTMDCHMHDAGSDSGDATAHDGNSGSCSSCQVCHGAAVEPVTAQLELPAAAQQPPRANPVRFASADLVRGTEPPIL